jgi:hypothetical protein
MSTTKKTKQHDRSATYPRMKVLLYLHRCADAVEKILAFREMLTITRFLRRCLDVHQKYGYDGLSGAAKYNGKEKDKKKPIGRNKEKLYHRCRTSRGSQMQHLEHGHRALLLFPFPLLFIIIIIINHILLCWPPQLRLKIQRNSKLSGLQRASVGIICAWKHLDRSPDNRVHKFVTINAIKSCSCFEDAYLHVLLSIWRHQRVSV